MFFFFLSDSLIKRYLASENILKYLFIEKSVDSIGHTRNTVTEGGSDDRLSLLIILDLPKTNRKF